jgi:hypothetical protein
VVLGPAIGHMARTPAIFLAAGIIDGLDAFHQINDSAQ